MSLPEKLSRSEKSSKKILIVLEGPSKYDELHNEPLTDQAGRDFQKFLHMAGIIYHDCETAWVCRHYIQEPRIKSKKKLRYFAKYTDKFQIVKPEVEQYHQRLADKISEVQPTVIIACGELSLFTLTGETSVSKYRGSILYTLPEFYGCKVIPTYTPEQIQVMYEWHFPLICDLKRARYESEFQGINKPKWDFLIRPGISAVTNRLEGLLKMAATPPENVSNERTYKIGSDGWLEISDVRTDERKSPDEILYKTPDGKKYLLSLDVETRQGYISCAGIAWSPLDAICIPFLAVDGNPHYWNEHEERIIVSLLAKLFRHPHIEWALQNGNYDHQYFIRSWGLYARSYCDTMQQQHTAWSGIKKSLDFQSSLKLRYYRYWKDEGKEFHENIKSPQEEEKYWEYNCKDCVTTFELALYNYLELEKLNQLDQYRFQMKQQKVALKMMLRGTRADKARRGELAMEVQDAIAVRQNRLEKILGQPINIRSPKQMSELFYTTLGQKKIINRYSGNTTTDDKALENIGLREPILRPVVQIIQELRSLGVFLGTFIKAPPSKDGRYRCSYKVAGPETFRWASSKDVFGEGLNLQNIPKGTEE